jgi:hypothetical protein
MSRPYKLSRQKFIPLTPVHVVGLTADDKQTIQHALSAEIPRANWEEIEWARTNFIRARLGNRRVRLAEAEIRLKRILRLAQGLLEELTRRDNVGSFIWRRLDLTLDLSHPAPMSKDATDQRRRKFLDGQEFPSDYICSAVSDLVARTETELLDFGQKAISSNEDSGEKWNSLILCLAACSAQCGIKPTAAKSSGGTTTPDPARPDPVAAGFASGEINVMIGYCSGTERGARRRRTSRRSPSRRTTLPVRNTEWRS